MENIFLVIPLGKKDKGIKQLVIKFNTWYFLSSLCKKKKEKIHRSKSNVLSGLRYHRENLK